MNFYFILYFNLNMNLFNPFRVVAMVIPKTQGVALGCNVIPLWGIYNNITLSKFFY